MPLELVLTPTPQNVTAALMLELGGVYRVQNLDSSHPVFWVRQAAAPVAGARSFVLPAYGELFYYPTIPGEAPLWMWSFDKTGAALLVDYAVLLPGGFAA